MLYKEEEDEEDLAEIALLEQDLEATYILELHAMNYKLVMKTANKPKWVQAVNEEHKRLIKMGVW